MFRLQHLTENLSDVGYFKNPTIEELKAYHECYVCGVVYTDKNICDLCYTQTRRHEIEEPRDASVIKANEAFKARQELMDQYLDDFITYLYQYETDTIHTKKTIVKTYEVRGDERILINETEKTETVQYSGNNNVTETTIGAIIVQTTIEYTQHQKFIRPNAFLNLIGEEFTYIPIQDEKLNLISVFIKLTPEYITRKYPYNVILYFVNLEKNLGVYMTHFPDWKTNPDTLRLFFDLS